MFKAIKQPPKNALKIDFVKMQKQHYTVSKQNQTKKMSNYLLHQHKPVHDKIISMPEQFKQVQETAFIILDVTQHN